jgi:hypothetical protein
MSHLTLALTIATLSRTVEFAIVTPDLGPPPHSTPVVTRDIVYVTSTADLVNLVVFLLLSIKPLSDPVSDRGPMAGLTFRAVFANSTSDSTDFWVRHEVQNSDLDQTCSDLGQILAFLRSAMALKTS